MNPRRRALLLGALAVLLAPPAPAQERSAGGFTFSELSLAQPVESEGKIEVLEFFWYGCPHCYSLEPAIESWLKRLPADAEFRRVPAVFDANWARDAAIFYTFEALGVLPKVHRPFFDAIHRDRLRTSDREALDAWLRKNGIDARKFDEAFKSFGVQSKVRRAQQMSVAYRIDGTPAMAVNGRYTVSAEQGRTQQGLLATVDYLIAQSRKPAAR